MNLSEIARSLADLWWQQMPGISLQIGILVALVALLTRVTKSWSAQLRYALWTVVVARLAVPVAFRSPLGVLPSATPAAPLRTSLVPFGGGVPEMAPAAVEAASSPLAAHAVAPARAIPFTFSWEQGLFLAWAAVVLALAGVWMWRYWRVRSALSNDSTAVPASIGAKALALGKTLGLRRPVSVRIADSSLGLNAPAVFGVLRPQILLPRELVENGASQLLEPVLLHELTHLRRRDHWVNALQGVVQIFYFFHPLVWWANRELRRERELACDEAVVHHLAGESRGYISSLLELTRRVPPVPRPRLTLPAMAAKRSFLGYRLERLANLPKTLRPRRRRVLVALALVVGISASLVFAGSSGELSADQPTQGPGETLRTEDGRAVAKIVENRTYVLPQGSLSDLTADLSPYEEVRSGPGPRVGKLLNPAPPRLSGKPSGLVSGSLVLDPEGRVHDASLLHRLDPRTDEEMLAFLRTLEFEIIPPSEESNAVSDLAGKKVEYVFVLVLRFYLEKGRFVEPLPKTTEKSWTTKPDQLFTLPAGSDVAVISPPFPSARLDFYRQQNPTQAGLIPEGPSHMLVHWDDAQGASYGAFTFGGTDLGSLLVALGLNAWDLSGDPSLLEAPAPFDVVLRAGLEVQDVLPELERELQQAGLPVRFEVRKEPREVIVVRGKATPFEVDPQFRVPTLHVYGDVRDPDLRGGPGAELPVEEAIPTLSTLLRLPMVTEAKTEGAGKVLLAFHKSARNRDNIAKVLANLEAQSGLEFSLEERPMDRIYVLPSEG